MNDDTALSVSTVFSCVKALADDVSTLPLNAYVKTKDRTRTLIDPPPQVVVNPWPEGTLQDWLTQVMVSLCLRGNFYGLIVDRDWRGYPSMIQPVHPDDMWARRDRSGAREYRYKGVKQKTSDVFHIPALLSPGSFVGMNPVEYMRSSWGLTAAAERYGGAFFSNSANPSGVILVKEDLDEEETLELARAWKMAHQGIGMAQMPAVLTSGAEWRPVSINPDDAQFLQTRDFQRVEIAGFFGVPLHRLGLQDRTSSWGCLPGETLVATVRGPRPIKDVRAGDEVWSLGEDGMVPAKVLAWTETGHKPLLTFHTRGRTVRATPNHHMLVRRWSSPGRGRRGEWLTLLVDARDVRVGDYFVVPHGYGRGVGTTAPDGTPLTVGLMELAGLYVGDGNLDGRRVEIAHARDEDHMPHYRRLVQAELEVEPYTDGRGTRTRFSHARFSTLMRDEFGCGAHAKRIPGWVYDLTPELQAAFLRGYLDSDGSVQRGVISFSSCNRSLLEDVRHLCMQLGVPVGLVTEGRPAGPGVINGQTHQAGIKWQLGCSSKSHNLLIGSNSPRKASRFDATPTERNLRYSADWKPTTDGRPPITTGWDAPGTAFHRVTRITESLVLVPVYDIEVDGTHTFSADGVIVGNTGIEQMELGYLANTLAGWLKRIESYLSAPTVTPSNMTVKFDLAARLRGDQLSRFQAYTLARNGGWLNIDEIREREDLPVLDNGLGQDYWAPLNFAPVDQIQQGLVGPAASGGIGGGVDSSPDAPPAPSPNGQPRN